MNALLPHQIFVETLGQSLCAILSCASKLLKLPSKKEQSEVEHDPLRFLQPSAIRSDGKKVLHESASFERLIATRSYPLFGGKSRAQESGCHLISVAEEQEIKENVQLSELNQMTEQICRGS